MCHPNAIMDSDTPVINVINTSHISIRGINEQKIKLLGNKPTVDWRRDITQK